MSCSLLPMTGEGDTFTKGIYALLVGGCRGVLGQLEEGVAHLARGGRHLGLLWSACIFLVPGHQRISLGLLMGQRPPGGAHGLSTLHPLPSWGAIPRNPPEGVLQSQPIHSYHPHPPWPPASPGVIWAPLPSLRQAQGLVSGWTPLRGEHCPGPPPRAPPTLRWAGGGRTGPETGARGGEWREGALSLTRPIQASHFG